MNLIKLFKPLCYTKVTARLGHLKDVLQPASERTKGLEACWRRCTEIETDLKQLIEDRDGDWIRWFETYKRTFTLTRTPFEIADEFAHLMAQRRATWIFTSATLTVSKRFDHFKKALGLKDARDRFWESPFDFATQALFYHPRNLPDPASSNFVNAVVQTAIPVLKASVEAFFNPAINPMPEPALQRKFSRSIQPPRHVPRHCWSTPGSWNDFALRCENTPV